jgi:hypothetical protein
MNERNKWDHLDPDEWANMKYLAALRPEPAPQTFAELLRAWRARQRGGRGITRAEAGRRLGVPIRTLEDWESNLHAPRGLARRLIEARLRRR